MREKAFFTALLLLCAATFANAQNLTREQYIKKYKDIAIKQMHKHRIPASITLAQACLESSNGNSTLARKANNHFGIKCHNGWKGKKIKHSDDQRNECFRKYKKAEDSFTDHSYFLVSGSRYNSLFDLPVHDYKAWAHGLKAAGYATNPNYAKLLIDIIEKYDLYKYDTGLAYEQSKAAAKAAKKAARKEKKLKKLERKAAKAEKKSAKANNKLNKFKGENAPAPQLGQPQHNNPQQGMQPQAASSLHTVNAGDTLYSIARKYDTTVEAIQKLNPGIKANALKPGSQLKIK